MGIERDGSAESWTHQHVAVRKKRGPSRDHQGGVAGEEGGNVREHGISENWEGMSWEKEFQSHLLSLSVLGGQIRYDRVALDLATPNLSETLPRANASELVSTAIWRMGWREDKRQPLKEALENREGFGF